MKKKFLILFIFIQIISLIFSQTVIINEYMSSNHVTIPDEDMEYPDWIEIYNAGAEEVNLNNFGLSDDSLNTLKWQFPEIILEPDNFLLIFASDKDRREYIPNWETVIHWGDIWNYRVGVSEPPADWNAIDFDDSSWDSGPSGFGYGDDDDATLIDTTISCYIRKIFTIDDPDNIINAILHVDYDDAFVAYINGIEVARSNIGQVGIPPTYDQISDTYIEAMIYQGGTPAPFPIENIHSIIQQGENILAMQVHNTSITSSDLSLIPFLTFGMYQLPENPRGVPEILTIQASYLHTNFKITSQGEDIILSDNTGQIMDRIFTGPMLADVSRGRQPDGSENWFYFLEPTPGTANITPAYTIIDTLPPVQFSLPAGFYSNDINISLSINAENTEIRYTTDGSDPDTTSMLYESPLILAQTTVVRAKAFQQGMLPSKITTHTYFINCSHPLPVISLSTTPANFWDNEYGIYVLGDNAEPEMPHYGANYWQDWERPIHVEFFEPDGQLAFHLDAGTKIFGGWTRMNPQKSLAIYARNQYGYDKIEYPIFPDKPIGEFESIILRNSGNDWNYTMLRDAFMTGLVKEIDLDIQAYRPAIVYLNGEYWGIHNVREKINEHFLAANRHVSSDNIDLLENDGIPIEGDAEYYNSMIHFLETNDISRSENYEQIKTFMNVDNFINYQVAQIYFDNWDWPGNNLKYWRPRTQSGKWRWILYDTDFGFNLYKDQDSQANTLEFATATDGPEHPNPPWSTFIFRTLLENTQFRNEYINRSCDFLNTIFLPARVLQILNLYKTAIEPEIGDHLTRWEGSIDFWNSEIQKLETFATQRPSHLRNHIRDKWDLGNPASLTIHISPVDAGKVKINSIIPQQYPFNGIYFRNVPLQISAIPAYGYEFSQWTGDFSNSDANMELSLTQNMNITANFEPADDYTAPVVINEINYHSSDSYDPGDWIEIYNNSSTPVDISEWIFKDENDSIGFTFPTNKMIEIGDYLVICNNCIAFSTCFPQVENFIGNFEFGLNNGGELLILHDKGGNVIDSLHYDDQSTWPTEPDGNGPTLELKSPNLDNSLGENWSASNFHGTPGAVNSVYTGILGENKNQLPKQFYLYQNYPNPFNPSTTLCFQLPSREKVTLKIYDILGRNVATIIDKYYPAGVHKIIWSIDNKRSTGIYFCQLKAGNKFNQIIKMVLIK
jgi:hypothetical protein